MQSKNTLLWVILIIVCVFAVILALSSFKQLRKMEFEFNEKKATLVRENLDLKDRIDSLQQIVSQKTEAVSAIENDKKTLEEKLALLKQENEKLMSSYDQQIETLKRKNAALRKKISALENSPVVQQIRAAIEKEENDSVKKVMEDALNKIDLIKQGKPVNLEPIIVTKKEKSAESSSASPSQSEPNAPGLGSNESAFHPNTASSAKQEEPQAPGAETEGKEGIILSVDQKSNLIIINLGRKDDIKEGDRCKIIKDGQSVAEAEVMSVRYRITAAFIDNIKYKNTIKDIKEGYKVLVVEKVTG